MPRLKIVSVELPAPYVDHKSGETTNCKYSRLCYTYAQGKPVILYKTSVVTVQDDHINELEGCLHLFAAQLHGHKSTIRDPVIF